MKRAFASNLVLLLGINFLIKPLYIFGIDREVQNAVGPEQYGLFFALLNLTYLFQIVNDCSFSDPTLQDWVCTELTACCRVSINW